MLTLCQYALNELKGKNALLHTFTEFSRTLHNAFFANGKDEYSSRLFEYISLNSLVLIFIVQHET